MTLALILCPLLVAGLLVLAFFCLIGRAFSVYRVGGGDGDARWVMFLIAPGRLLSDHFLAVWFLAWLTWSLLGEIAILLIATFLL